MDFLLIVCLYLQEFNNDSLLKKLNFGQLLCRLFDHNPHV